MIKEIRDLQQMSLDNPAVGIVEKVTRWEEELKEKGWDEFHIKQIIRNRIRREERRNEQRE